MNGHVLVVKAVELSSAALFIWECVTSTCVFQLCGTLCIIGFNFFFYFELTAEHTRVRKLQHIWGPLYEERITLKPDSP